MDHAVRVSASHGGGTRIWQPCSTGLDRDWLAGCSQVLRTTPSHLADAAVENMTPYVFIALPGGDGRPLGHRDREVRSAFNLSSEGVNGERPPPLYAVATARGDPSVWTNQRYQQRIPCSDQLCAVYEATDDETGASRGVWIGLAALH